MATPLPAPLPASPTGITPTGAATSGEIPAVTPTGTLTPAALDPSIANKTIPGTSAPVTATANPQLVNLASMVALYQDIHDAINAGTGQNATQPQTVAGSGVFGATLGRWGPLRSNPVGTEPTPGARQAQARGGRAERAAGQGSAATELAATIQAADPQAKNPGQLAADIIAGRANVNDLRPLAKGLEDSIFRQVGEFVPGRAETNPDELLQLPIGDAATGMGLQPGTTIAAAVKGVTTNQPAPGGGGLLTAQDLYTKFADDWNASPAYQKAMTQTLFDAGYLGTTQPSTSQVADAYKNVITQAVSGTNPETTSQVLTAATSAAQSPALKQGESETNYQSIVTQSAETYGADLSTNEVNAIAAQAQAQNWDATHIDQVVRQSYSPQAGGTDTGLAGAIASNLQTVAKDYLIPLSDTSLQKYVTQYIQQGLDSTDAADSFKQYAQQTAAGLYPTLAPQIQSGITTDTLLSPYEQQASKVLGVDPESIDWTSPQWSQALSGSRTANGQPTIMDLNTFTNYLRSNPAFNWSSTQDAQNAYSSTANMILKTFGAAATTGM